MKAVHEPDPEVPDEAEEVEEESEEEKAIDVTNEDSFPASDPPSWTPTVAGSPAPRRSALESSESRPRREARHAGLLPAPGARPGLSSRPRGIPGKRRRWT